MSQIFAVTGSTGRVGNRLVRALRDRGSIVAEITRANLDLATAGEEEIAAVLAATRESDEQELVVIHCAGLVGRTPCSEDPELATLMNVDASGRISSSVGSMQNARLVFVSTADAYGQLPIEQMHNPVTENTPSGPPSNHYAATKRAGELMCWKFAPAGLQILRLSNSYGNDEVAGPNAGAITNFVAQAIAGDAIRVFRNSSRSWIWMDDCVEAMLLAIDNGEQASTSADQKTGTGVFNIAWEADLQSLEATALVACEIVGASPSLVEVVDAPGGLPPARVLSTDKLDALGFTASTSLREGLSLVAGGLQSRTTEQWFIVVGGSLSQSSLLSDVQSRGLRTCVIDGSATAPLLERADVGIHVDFSNTEEVLRRLDAEGISRVAGVATMGSDAAVLPTARLVEHFGVAGLSVDAATVISSKTTMREAFRAHGNMQFADGGPISSVEEARDMFDRFGDIVLKPVDGSGQRGVTHVQNRHDIANAFDRAQRWSRTNSVIGEAFLQGDEFTVSGFVHKGTYLPIIVTRRVLFPAPPLGVCRAHRYPNDLTPELEQTSFAAAKAATEAVGISDGPSYVQIRIVGDTAFVIEIGARLGGGKDAELAALVTGINQVPAVVESALGTFTEASLSPHSNVKPCGQVVFFVARPSGTVEHLAAPDVSQIDGLHEIGFYYAVGGNYPPFVDGAGRLGYFIVSADSPDELDARTSAIEAAIDVVISPATSTHPDVAADESIVATTEDSPFIAARIPADAHS